MIRKEKRRLFEFFMRSENIPNSVIQLILVNMRVRKNWKCLTLVVKGTNQTRDSLCCRSQKKKKINNREILRDFILVSLNYIENSIKTTLKKASKVQKSVSTKSPPTHIIIGIF